MSSVHYYIEPVRAAPGSPLAVARCKAHSAFDTKWKSGQMKRSQAYNWLSQKLGIPKRDCHIVYFDEAMCQRVVDLCVVDMFDAL